MCSSSQIPMMANLFLTLGCLANPRKFNGRSDGLHCKRVNLFYTFGIELGGVLTICTLGETDQGDIFVARV